MFTNPSHQLLTLLTTTTLLLLTPSLAAPLDTTTDITPTPTPTSTTPDQQSPSPSEGSEQSQEGEGGGNKPAAIQAANYGSPRCKSAALEDLCISGNAEAYCDGNGFHCNFMASCKGVCWCE